MPQSNYYETIGTRHTQIVAIYDFLWERHSANGVFDFNPDDAVLTIRKFLLPKEWWFRYSADLVYENYKATYTCEALRGQIGFSNFKLKQTNESMTDEHIKMDFETIWKDNDVGHLFMKWEMTDRSTGTVWGWASRRGVFGSGFERPRRMLSDGEKDRLGITGN